MCPSGTEATGLQECVSCSFQPCSSYPWLAFAGVNAVELFSILNAKKSLSPAPGVYAESCRRSRSLSGGGWTWMRAWRRLATCLSCPTRTPDSAGARCQARTLSDPSAPVASELARWSPLEEEYASSSAIHRYVFIHTHPYPSCEYVLYQLLSNRSTEPLRLRGTTNSWLTLSHEFQLLTPKQRVVYTQCFIGQTFFFFFFWLWGVILLPGTQEEAFPTEQQCFGLFLCYLFLAFTENEETEARTHHHVSWENLQDLGRLPHPPRAQRR